MELYAGLLIQAAIILTWVWFVYRGADGPQHLKVFFWNNLVGRFAAVDAPPDLQYAAAHRNSPGKYLIELPMYLFPWTLLAIAAARRAWRQRQSSRHDESRGALCHRRFSAAPRGAVVGGNGAEYLFRARPARELRCSLLGGRAKSPRVPINGMYGRCAARPHCCWSALPYLQRP